MRWTEHLPNRYTFENSPASQRFRKRTLSAPLPRHSAKLRTAIYSGGELSVPCFCCALLIGASLISASTSVLAAWAHSVGPSRMWWENRPQVSAKEDDWAPYQHAS